MSVSKEEESEDATKVTGPNDRKEGLSKMLERHRQENLMAEIGDLKSMLKRKDEKIEELEKQLKNRPPYGMAEYYNSLLESEKSKLQKLRDDNEEMERMQQMSREELKRGGEENRDLRIQNIRLQDRVESLESERAELHDASDRMRMEKETSDWEKRELKIQLKQQSEKAADFEKRMGDLCQKYLILEKSSNEAVESIKVLKVMESENVELKNQLKHAVEKTMDLERRISHLQRSENQLKLGFEQQSEKLRIYGTRLEEHREEIGRLTMTKESAIWGCRDWIIKCRQMINISIAVFEEKYSAENLQRLKDNYTTADSEHTWWADYYCLSSHLSMAFKAIQEVRSLSDSEDEGRLRLIRDTLRDRKETYGYCWKVVSDGKEGKEWVETELASKYFETWEKLVMEKVARIEEP